MPLMQIRTRSDTKSDLDSTETRKQLYVHHNSSKSGVNTTAPLKMSDYIIHLLAIELIRLGIGHFMYMQSYSNIIIFIYNLES